MVDDEEFRIRHSVSTGAHRSLGALHSGRTVSAPPDPGWRRYKWKQRSQFGVTNVSPLFLIGGLSSEQVSMLQAGMSVLEQVLGLKGLLLIEVDSPVVET